ncbi:MAG: NAD(P)H-hydrate dehydratase [Ignisphaera sp.]
MLSKYVLKICSVEEMKRIDEDTAKICGIDHLLLMEDAGSAVFSAIVKEIGDVLYKRFLVVAGTGNNGGDALVAGRRIYSAGGDVKVVVVGDVSRATELCRKNLELVKALGIEVVNVSTSEELDRLRKLLDWCEYVVVGLIGIGLRGEVRGLYREVIEEINRWGKPVVSIDIPSGIDGNNGLVRGVAIKSWLTVTLGLPKYGNILYPGYSYCGKLYVSFLSYPRNLLEDIKTELNTPIQPPERVKWGHKGVFGKFLAVAGSRYYYGAPYYVSYSFLKAGGGYSRLATPKSVVPYIAARCSEVVYIPLEETAEGSIALSNLEHILDIVEEYSIDIVAVGPGISLNQESQQLVRELITHIDRPVIVDGDGITAVARDIEIIRKRKAQTVITPHLAEFSRLIGLEIKNIQENPIGILRKSCRELNAYIVLKGAHSLIGYPDGYVYINMTGNPGMAKAGSGDVLTGAIAAMYGIGYRDIGLATRMGVLIHGLAGDLAADDIGEDGVTPDDIMNYLPRAVKLLRENHRAIIDRYFPKLV